MSSLFVPGATSLSSPPLQQDVEAWITRNAGKVSLRRAGGGGPVRALSTGKLAVASPIGGDKDSPWEQLRREQAIRANEHYLLRLPSVRRHIGDKLQGSSGSLGSTLSRSWTARPLSLGGTLDSRSGVVSAPATVTGGDIGMCTGQAWWRPQSVPAGTSEARAKDDFFSLTSAQDERVSTTAPIVTGDGEEDDDEEGDHAQPSELLLDVRGLTSPSRHTWHSFDPIDLRMIPYKPRTPERSSLALSREKKALGFGAAPPRSRPQSPRNGNQGQRRTVAIVPTAESDGLPGTSPSQTSGRSPSPTRANSKDAEQHPTRPRPAPLGASAGIAPIKTLPSDPDNFLRLAGIKAALEDRDTVLVRGDWVIGLGISGGVLPRRQEVPEGAIVQPSRLTSQDKIVAVSYCWLTEEHPDPQGNQLQIMSRVLWQFSQYWDGANVAIFIDWCSLYQEPRSKSEKAAFHRSLRHIHLWYTHQDISLWMLTKFPDEQSTRRYWDRGWPTFEHALAGLVTPARMVLDLGKLDEGCEDFLSTIRTCVAKRPAPEDPESFYQTLLTKSLSKGADRSLLEEKYQEAFQAAVVQATKLYYSTLGWEDGEIVKLSVTLPNCTHLTALDLSDNRITPDGFTNFCHCLPSCTALARLALDKNLLRNRGLELLSHVLPRCFSLKWLDLRHNQIGKLGVDRLACCHMPTHLRFVDLRGNNVKRGHTSAERMIEAWKRAGKPLEGLLLSMPGL